LAVEFWPQAHSDFLKEKKKNTKWYFVDIVKKNY